MEAMNKTILYYQYIVNFMSF